MDPKKQDAVATQGTAAMARPDFVSTSDRSGTEHIKQEDIQIPRIVLAQKMSPEVDDSDAKRIENLKPGDMFNGLTKEIYGRGPLTFVILRADPPRYVVFGDRESGGGIIDPNVPADDPRTQFGPNGEKPEATKFYDFVVSLLPVSNNDPGERMMALSFKSTGLKIAKQLNALIMLRNAPIHAGVYKLTSVDVKNSKGTFAMFNVANAGWVESKELYDQFGQMAETMKHKDLTNAIQREPGDDDGDFPGDGADGAVVEGATKM